MPFVIAEPCIGVKDRSCVSVCPVDCIQGGDDDTQLFINPDECIDCALCEPECPVNAIMSEDDLSQEQKMFVDLNRELSQTWPNITAKKDALADSDQWQNVENKLQYLIKEWPSE